MIKVLQCPNCGWIQASTANKTFKCRKCDKSKQLRRVKIIKIVRDNTTARALISILRKRNY